VGRAAGTRFNAIAFAEEETIAVQKATIGGSTLLPSDRPDEMCRCLDAILLTERGQWDESTRAKGCDDCIFQQHLSGSFKKIEISNCFRPPGVMSFAA
jgi:hypothetical protein